MAYVITGTATFSTQARRDAARTRVDAAIAAFSFINRSTVFTAGITHPTTTTMTVSIETDVNPGELGKAIYDAWVQSNRHDSGYLSVNKI